MDARCTKALWVCWDLVKLAPSTGWLIMCCFAIPSYSAIGWVTPVVCAVFSSILAICATYDIFLFLSPTVYTLIGGDDAKRISHRVELNARPRSRRCSSSRAR